MTIGVISGLIAAMFNSIGYLVSARYLQKYNSPFKLLITAQFCMLMVAVLFLPWLFPWTQISHLGMFFLVSLAWVTVFMIGQGAFFMALRYFEASRLSSLLGLKIIVLAVMFMISQRVLLNGGQIIAVFIAAAAGIMFNWSGAGKTNACGWLFVCLTLVFYSSADLLETNLILRVKDSGFDAYTSAFATTAFIYSLLGLVSIPLLFKLKPAREEFKLTVPYAVLWLCSQASLFICFAMIKPVFGNVVLALRGVFSVVIGALLPLVGLGALDSKISSRKWIQRGVAACLMMLAIGLYSYYSAKP